MTANQIMNVSKIVPVIALDDEKDALPLASALSAGGINIMEITLRTEAGLKAIKEISSKMPEIAVGAGTVCNKEDFVKAVENGAKFVFSPGISQELIDTSKELGVTLIPGVATASEVMMAQNNGIGFCKLFPASIVGGVEILKAFQGPFSSMKFCPTGGVSLQNLNEFLSLKNVVCVGGTWIVPKNEIKNGNFDKITQLCVEAINSIEG